MSRFVASCRDLSLSDMPKSPVGNPLCHSCPVILSEAKDPILPRTSLMRSLERLGTTLRVKGRAFGSPLARGFYPRESTAEVDPRAKPGALTRDVNTRLSTAEADPPDKAWGPCRRPGRCRIAALPSAVRKAKKISDFLILSKISGRPIVDRSGELS
jgi:hypothetical protein